MVWIVVAAGAVALLYGWLVGWWFARVLVFLGIGAVTIMACTGEPSATWIGAGVIVAGWFVSGAPGYWQRWRATQESLRGESMSLSLRD